MRLGPTVVVFAGIAVLAKFTISIAGTSETLDPWPFIMGEVTLSCEKNRVFVMTPDGQRYAVNGTAKTSAPEPRIETIQAYYDTSAVIRRGNRLCETRSEPIRLVAPHKAIPPEPAQPSLKIEPREVHKGFYATVEAMEAIDGKRPELTFVCERGEPLGLQLNLVRAPQTAPPLRGVFGSLQLDTDTPVRVELSWGMDGRWAFRGKDEKHRVQQDDRLARAMLAGQKVTFSGPAGFIAHAPITWEFARFGDRFAEVRKSCGVSRAID